MISPVLANIFMHYVFDDFMDREFKNIPWCRYADDGLCHCVSLKQAKYLKKLSQEGRLTTEKIEEIMGEQKPNQVEKIKIKADRIQKLLPKEIVTEQQTEEFIIKCIKEHNQREERKREMVR